MNKIDISSFISQLDVKTPADTEFLKLSKQTPINPLNQYHYLVNYERGILLYALVAKYRPNSILEIGTASGYSTLCMAWSMVDNNIDGKIYTIDPNSVDAKVEFVTENKKEVLSKRDRWKQIAPSEWLLKIEPITGYSGEIMASYKFPKIQFAFIDGSHHYEAVRHDFYSFLQIASENFGVLLDDYLPTPVSQGLAKLVDGELTKNFDITLIETNYQKQRQQLNRTTGQMSDEGANHALCWIHSDSLKKPLTEIYPQKETVHVLKQYRNYEKRWKIRKKLNEKFPFLKKTRFSNIYKPKT